MMLVRVVGASLLSFGLLGVFLYTATFFGFLRIVDQDLLVKATVYAIAVGILAVISVLGYLALTAPVEHLKVNRGGGR
jgi:hypothetical protein